MIDEMAKSLGLARSFITGIARGASYEYKKYQIPKRSGGTRTIHHPSRRLKALQRWLLQNIIEKLPVHNAAMAYRPGVSILDNAKAHAQSSFLLRMDFEEFFPSIKRTDIEYYIAMRPHLFTKWSPEDIDTFCRLICRHSALTIGAPCSPALSNVLCYDLDTDLESIAKKASVTYTRYADDLFFSTQSKNVLRSIENQVPAILQRLSMPATLILNKSKTKHSSRRGTRRVTGVILGSDGIVHIGRSLKRRIRSLIHHYDELTDKEKATLAGLINYAGGSDPDFINQLILKYGTGRVQTAKTPRPFGATQ